MPSKSPHRGLLPIDPTIETRLRVNMEFVYHVASCHYVERVSSAPIQLSIAYDRGPLAILGEEVFDLLDKIGRLTRKRLEQPFGGIQVIFSGDFYQLPPIGHGVQFCFESTKWRECFEHQIIFNTIFRQNDSVFKSVLNQIREGRLNKEGFEL